MTELQQFWHGHNFCLFVYYYDTINYTKNFEFKSHIKYLRGFIIIIYVLYLVLCIFVFYYNTKLSLEIFVCLSLIFDFSSKERIQMRKDLYGKWILQTCYLRMLASLKRNSLKCTKESKKGLRIRE